MLYDIVGSNATPAFVCYIHASVLILSGCQPPKRARSQSRDSRIYCGMTRRGTKPSPPDNTTEICLPSFWRSAADIRQRTAVLCRLIAMSRELVRVSMRRIWPPPVPTHRMLLWINMLTTRMPRVDSSEMARLSQFITARSVRVFIVHSWIWVLPFVDAQMPCLSTMMLDTRPLCGSASEAYAPMGFWEHIGWA